MVLGLEQPLPVMDSDDEVLRAMRKLSEYKSNLESALYSEFLYRRSDVENLKLLIQQFLGYYAYCWIFATRVWTESFNDVKCFINL